MNMMNILFVSLVAITSTSQSVYEINWVAHTTKSLKNNKISYFYNKIFGGASYFGQRDYCECKYYGKNIL